MCLGTSVAPGRERNNGKPLLYCRAQFVLHGYRVQYLGLSPCLCLSSPESRFSFRVSLLISCTTWPFSRTSPSNWRSSSWAVSQTRLLQAKPSSRYVSPRQHETERRREPTCHLVRFMEYKTTPQQQRTRAPLVSDALSLGRAHDCFKEMFWSLVNWWVMFRNELLLPW